MNNKSLELRRKPNSHTKLPLVNTQSVDHLKRQASDIRMSQPAKLMNDIKELNKPSGSKSQTAGHRNSVQMKLLPIHETNAKIGKIATIQQLGRPSEEETNYRGKINSKKKGQFLNNNTQISSPKLEERINNIAQMTINSESKSEGTAREAFNPIIKQINSLLSHAAQQSIFAARIYPQKSFGSLQAQWWCVVDSVFLSLQKLIKIKKSNVEDKTKPEQPINKSNNSNSQSPRKLKRQSPTKQPTGTVITNMKSAIQLTFVYSCLEEELCNNEMHSFGPFEDYNHVILILEAYFYEKAMIYLLASTRIWSHPDQILYINTLAIEIIPCVRENRKLIGDIVVETIQNQLVQDNKIRKPKYIARQKKLIQISKFIGLMKESYEKCIKNLGSPNRYRIFFWPQNGIKEHDELIRLQTTWRHIIFDRPVAPYIAEPLNSLSRTQSSNPQQPNKKNKQFLLILEPLNILYKYNKKQQTLHIFPYAQNFLEQMSQIFHIVLFTHCDKDESLLNFIVSIENKNVEICFILDRDYMSHWKAKLIKDIKKIGGGQQFGFINHNENNIRSTNNNNSKVNVNTNTNLQKMLLVNKNRKYKNNLLIIDQRANSKYYSYMSEAEKNNLLLLEGNYAQTRLGRVGGKLVRIQEDNQDFLKHLSRRIIKCAKQQADWYTLLKDQHK